MRKKITDLSYLGQRTIEKRGKDGKLQRTRTEVRLKRHVNLTTPGTRFGHFLIDGVCINLISYGIGLMLSLFELQSTAEVTLFFVLGMAGMGVMRVLVGPFYYTIFEYLFGQTPGKMVTRSYVIDDYGDKPPIEKLLLRNIIRMVPFEAFSCLSDRGWHDKWSDTWVVPKEEMLELRRLLREEEKAPPTTAEYTSAPNPGG